MNALPLKPGQNPADILDDLIANHGLRAVLLALMGKLVKRTRPPDTTGDLARLDHPDLDLLPDHLRADIGLPRNGRQKDHLLHAYAMQRDLFHF